MGQIKNIKLHIVTDIKGIKMAVLTTTSAGDVMDGAVNPEDTKLYNSVLDTSRFFTSLVELLPAKFYLSQKDEEEENIFNPKKMRKRKKKPPADKKFLAKKAKLLKLDPSQHKTITELQEEVEKKEKEAASAVVMTATKIQPISVSQVDSSQSLSDLHEKLHAKMKQLRGNRKDPAEYKNNKNSDSTNNAESRKRKQKEKKKQEVEKKKKDKESANIKISNAIENQALNNTDGGGKKNKNKEDGEIVFSKFDFATREPKVKKKKDLKQLLSKAESKESELKALEATDAEAAREAKVGMSWDSAMERAKGTKVEDDPKLLKKTLKRKEKEKSKSGKQWKDRTESVEKKMEEK